MSRVVAEITRLCEPFQQAQARMPLDKLAPESEEEARRRLLEVVDQELDRIGQLRAMLQKIADADAAEAPVRLAFETGTEGDRGRRYILSYERRVNRRIDTFLKVRKASGSGELDFVELAESIGEEELAELANAAGTVNCQGAGDLRSGEGRGRTSASSVEPETLAQQPETDACGDSSDVSPMGQHICNDRAILRNEPIAAPDDSGGRARNAEEDTPGSEAAAPGARWTSQLDPSHPAPVTGHGADLQPSPQTETTAAPNESARIDQAERTAILAMETAEDATESDVGSAGASVCLSPGVDGDLASRCDESAYSVRATIEPTTTVTPCEQAICDDDTILRNKAIAAPDGSPIDNLQRIYCATVEYIMRNCAHRLVFER